jgi:uncharacterized protein YceK
MRKQRVIWLRLAALAVLAGCGVGWCSQAPAPKTQEADNKDAPKPLPPDVVTAWQNQGARVIWMRLHENVYLPDGCFLREGGFLQVLRQNEGSAGALPAFQLRVWNEKVLASLPGTGTPFGLSLANTQMTDAGLNELAGVKSLQALDLAGTGVTDAGLKELAGLKSLQWLVLLGTKTTAAGTNELQKVLPGCRIIG